MVALLAKAAFLFFILFAIIRLLAVLKVIKLNRSEPKAKKHGTNKKQRVQQTDHKS